MDTYLGFSSSLLKEKGALFTATEITAQPNIWEKTYKLFRERKREISSYISGYLSLEGLNIILTGAGSSAFIGEVVAPIMQRAFNVPVRAVATTDIVTHPEYYLMKKKPTLIFSFARSGNSPESIKTVELINEINDFAGHFIITCNKDGNLAKMVREGRDYLFLLPEESNDKSLAMTSSFTSMLFSAILVSDTFAQAITEKDVFSMAEAGLKIINEHNAEIERISGYPFKRAIFLGSGPMQGIARESHLKLQEMTDGQIICKFDTFLGFRHGPKAVIDKDTLIVYLFSENPYVRMYEEDLALSLKKEGRFLYEAGIAEFEHSGCALTCINYGGNNGETLSEILKFIPSVLPVQILAFHKSLELGLMPDNPSVSGAISRVVEGVKIYPYKGAEV